MMSMNTKAKGSRNERLIRDFFIEYGYSVIKSGASLGEFDLIAISSNYTQIRESKTVLLGDGMYAMTLNPLLLIQVKSNRLPPASELKKMMAFTNKPQFSSTIIAIVHDGYRGKKDSKKIQIIKLI